MLYQGGYAIKYIPTNTTENVPGNIVSQVKDCKQGCLKNRAQGWTGVIRFKPVLGHESHHISPGNKSVSLCVYSHAPFLHFLSKCIHSHFKSICSHVKIIVCNQELFLLPGVYLFVYLEITIFTSPTSILLGTASFQTGHPFLWSSY